MSSHYDEHGRLKFPGVCWLALIFLIKGWIIVLLTLATGGYIIDIAAMFYPNMITLIVDLICGVPVFVFLFFYGIRDKWPLVMLYNYFSILFGCFFSIVAHSVNILSGEGLSIIAGIYSIFDLFWGGASLIALFPSKVVICSIQGK
ncbi:DUF2919 family protein [Escherichia coli]|nr:DUF2919 family protein [Escherichia coli]EHW7739123.1 DUF2919 family protein [Escherichia coli]EJY0872159.1 DUF2919 family protein [Escherichia coli]